MKLINLFLSAIILLIYNSCGIEQKLEPEFLNPPGGVVAYSLNNKIKIKFYSHNSEDTFDGFNIYISKESSVKSKKINPVKNPSTGAVPTISLLAKNISPDSPIEITLNRDSNDEYIENGITYFIIIKSHNMHDYKSDASNEVSATPRISNLTGINIPINNGFNISAQDTSTPWSFKFEKINNNYYIIPQNSNGIISKGFYSDWNDVNLADENNYTTTDIPILINTGYVFIIKTTDSHYGKIQIKEITDTEIKFIWAYQQIQNNREI